MSEQMQNRTLVTIVIPVYNERDTWRELVGRVARVDLPGCSKQIIMVDDGSTDGTRSQLRDFAPADESQLAGESACPVDLKVIFHERNRGKGAALRTGFTAACGDVVLIQDADLEYDPRDYPKLLAPIITGKADVVYGSRFSGSGRKGHWKNYLANKFLTWLSNLTTGLKLTDMETCYKGFRREVLCRIHLEQDRFGFEPEITAKVARLAVRVCEVPIRYEGRTSAEGKKIGFKDGLNAISCIFKYGRLSRRRRRV